MVPRQSAEFPMKRSRFEPQWEHIPRYIKCVFFHLLMEECISDVMYWYGVQVSGQYVTEFLGRRGVLHCLNLSAWEKLALVYELTMIRVENGCLLWYIGHSEIFSDTWEKNDVIKGGWICFCDGPYYIFTKVKQYLLANSHLLKPEVDSGFSQTCRMELFSKTSLKPLFIFVKIPIPDILLSWMRPRYYFKYTMYPRK